jgi:hypothetical protein
MHRSTTTTTTTTTTTLGASQVCEALQLMSLLHGFQCHILTIAMVLG